MVLFAHDTNTMFNNNLEICQQKTKYATVCQIFNIRELPDTNVK